MAERKKVQKTNPRQKTRHSAPRHNDANKSAVKSVPKTQSIKQKPTKKTAKYNSSAPERIQMEAKKSTSLGSASEKFNTRSKTERSNSVSHSRKQSASKPVSKSRTENINTNTNRTQLHRVKQNNIGVNLSVILGNRLEVRRKRLITFVIAVAVIGAILSFCISSPTGPFERITNSFAVLGGGKYPASISGTGVKALSQINGKSFVLSNSHLDGYNVKGKEFFSIQHNFSNPVLEVSHERTLIYNRESNGFIISNNSDILFEQNLKYPIYTGDIADNGSVAFATKASGYAAQIQVFDRNMKHKFTWYLVEGLISDVALSNNGKYLAISVLKVKDGSFLSEILCFDISKEEPIFTFEEKSVSVVTVEAVSSNCFAYLSNEELCFVNWKTGAKNEAQHDGLKPAFFRVGAEKTYAVFGEAARSLVVIYDKKGNILQKAELSGLIDDISVTKKYIYVLRSNQILVFDWQSNLVGSIMLEQKPFFISTMKNRVYSVDNLALTGHLFLEKEDTSDNK